MEKDTCEKERTASFDSSVVNCRVTPEFRSLVQEMYPGLDEGDSEFRWRLMQYLIFSHRRSAEDGSYPAHQRLIMAMHGVEPNSWIKGWSVESALQEFAEEVLPLSVSDWHWSQVEGDAGRCRRITPLWTDEEYATIFRERLRSNSAPKEGKILFVDGASSRRKVAAEERGVQDYLDRLTESNDPHHPARALLDYLNGSDGRVLRRLYTGNRDALYAKITELPLTTKEEQASADYVDRILSQIDNTGVPALRYVDSERTSRVSAAGVNITQLPRDFRKVALHGATSCDLTSAQLGIVARLWDCPKAQAFLESGGSIWHELADYLGVDAKTYKPILKSALYSLCFGMCKIRLLRLVSLGYTDERDRLANEVERKGRIGLGKKLASKWKRHPLIAELLTRRKAIMEEVKAQGYAEDAFGRAIYVRAGEQIWEPTPGGKYQPRTINDVSVRSVLAAQAQSYEVRIMLSMLPIIKARRLTVACWIHDGLYLSFRDPSRKESALRDLVNAVQEEATRLRISTRLECEDI